MCTLRALVALEGAQRHTEARSPVEFSQQQGDSTVRRVHHLLQHHYVTAGHDLQEQPNLLPAAAARGLGRGVTNSGMAHQPQPRKHNGTRKDLGKACMPSPPTPQPFRRRGD